MIAMWYLRKYIKLVKGANSEYYADLGGKYGWVITSAMFISLMLGSSLTVVGIISSALALTF